MVSTKTAEELKTHNGRKSTWYPHKSWPVLWLGTLLGLIPWGRSGRWTACSALYTATFSMVMVSAFAVSYYEYHKQYHYPMGSAAWVCEITVSVLSLLACVLTLLWFKWRWLSLRKLMKACSDVDCEGSEAVSRWPIFLAVIKAVEVLLNTLWYIEELLLIAAPTWLEVAFALTIWYHCLTASFPILLYVSLADLLAQHATSLNASLGRAISEDRESLEGKEDFGSMGSTEVADEAVEAVAQEWRHLDRLHHRVEEMLSVPLLASAADMCGTLVGSAFFLSELDSVYHAVSAGIMMVSCISFLHVQGHVSDALQQQTLAVHKRVNQYLASKRLPPTGTLDHLLVTQVAQLSVEAGEPLEVSLVGLYTLSRSNFLPAVGATVAHLVILLQFYLANVSSNRHSLPYNSTDCNA